LFANPWTIALAALAAGLLCAPAGAAWAQTVILVRHAEQDRTVAGNDQPLSGPGQVRAEALAGALANAHVSLILTSPLRRTIDTAVPTARRAGLASRTIPLGPEHLAQTVAAARAAGPQGVVLIVGHSNTVPGLIKALGGKDAPNLPDDVYDTLTTLRLDGPKVVEVDSRYGGPSTPSVAPPAP
jgi:broad specificity phosphatase PhoE